MLQGVVPASTAMGEDTREALTGLVGGGIGGSGSMPPVVAAKGKTRGFKTWEAMTGLIRGGFVDIGGMLLVVVTVGKIKERKNIGGLNWLGWWLAWIVNKAV